MEYFTNFCVILAQGPRMTHKDIHVCVYVRERDLNESLIFLKNYQRWITARGAAAAAAASLQSCPTLCDPIEGSPPGSAVPGILQARVLEWGEGTSHKMNFTF